MHADVKVMETLLSCLEKHVGNEMGKGCGLLCGGQLLHSYPLTLEDLIFTTVDIIGKGVHATDEV